jgi:hypothetical protein
MLSCYRWSGYGLAADTWEPASSLDDELIADFEEQHTKIDGSIMFACPHFVRFIMFFFY